MSCIFRLWVAIFFLILVSAGATQQISITNDEPAIYKLSDLFLHADKVAIVKVISGDTEAYEVSIYKARVIKAFKGVSEGDIVYFGPYERTELGGEYVLFLRNAPNPIEPKDKGGAYGTVRYSTIFNEGYSSMLTSYECVFDGSTIAQQCDYGVRVCTDYIILPKSIKAFPPGSDVASSSCRWVRRDLFTSLLNEMAEKAR
jgi:hypothetical protein